MLTIAYRFHVLPRHHEHFRFAYHSARDTLQRVLGLTAHEFREPRDRREPFTLRLAWDSRASFERFTRTWAGLWMLNGMGLSRDAFAAPIETDIGEEETAPSARKHAA
jgi:hypothetical protein